MRRQLKIALGAAMLFAWLGTAAGAQTSSRALDTATLNPEALSVYHTWQRYLASKDGKWSERAGLPSPDWLAAEQQRWPVYDLASYYLADGATPEILSIESVSSCGQAAYRITTGFRHEDRNPTPPSWWTAVAQTVFAVRDGSRWFLSNALIHNTCTWRRVAVGTITYVFPADYPYNEARARKAVAFVDSLASVFQLPSLDSLTYYLTANVDAMYATLGLASQLSLGPTPVGGLAQPVNRQLFAGNVSIGEDYRHELAHLVLAPLCCARTSYLVSEGVPTWLGGTGGMNFQAAVRALAGFLRQHQSVSLDSVLAGSLTGPQYYTAGAVLIDMVFERRGVAAVRALFDAGGSPDDVRAAVVRELGRSWPTIVHDWHRRVLEFGKPAVPMRLDH